ncbi:tRNA (guanine-N(7)-)-methyltransferase [Hartmannibacter diazotrophicus]|uniref:tRNA (guanine-N(7)-)-methyltransferase n=1 Tax=Hartmannibacter diazotrophicus TaxID=1482074 RepID=A0A2C9DDG9_9HYPH|nr:tRNA (guanosine(46)-N7)-methyltransferase TrmB [Hartmannibacter diazotrophicus]SON58209.1 tRNA (guanine-N(7)-)-methyltransferase [Hartmannibacter diazotrophicus]
MTEMNEARDSAFYGRRKGRPLRDQQAARFDDLYPRLALDLAAPVADAGALFPHAPDEIHLEIGFGGGEHLIHRAVEAPGVGFIGVEPFVNGMAKTLMEIDRRQIGNIRLSDADAVKVLDALPDASLTRISLLYPDPWPKKRHWKRRFVGPDNVARFARVLKPGGEFRFASDIDTYVDWTLRHVRFHPDFEWMARRAADWQAPYPGWPGTRYEAKALREGRTPAYLTFRRL